MKSKVTLTALFGLLLLLSQTASAQCVNAYYEFLDGNKVNARMHNGADHFWDYVQNPSYEVPKGSGKHSTFAGSFWIGGMDQSSTLYLSANTYRQQGTDFYAGPYRSTGNYVCDRGFTSPSNTFQRGLITLFDGRVVAMYSNGFTIYNPANGNVTSRVLPVIRNNFQGVQLPDGRLLLFGDDVYPVKSDAMIVDTVNFNVQTIGQLNHWHKNSSITRLGTGQILLAGITGCEIFDPATTTSTAVTSMNAPRQLHASALLSNGKVLVAGGSTNLGGTGFLSTTEIYDPAANTWTVGPIMAAGRNTPVATVLNNGNVLITGGTTTQPDFNLYDPATNTMTAVQGIGEPFQRHSALLLGNGELLIAYENNFAFAPGIARYDPTTLAVKNVRLSSVQTRMTAISGGLVMIEREQNKFAQFDPFLNRLIDQPWQYMWKLSRSQINQFIADYSNNQVNFANYPDIETWPAHGDTAQGEDLHIAPFVDVNQDGRYRPLEDGDYPCIEGDQALWWAYNDDGPHTETGGNAMGIQVEQMAYSYDCGATPCTPDSFLDYATFHHLEITNKSPRNYEEVYVTVWLDVDVGEWTDDYIGSDSALGLGYAFNGDSDDQGQAGYGLNPPALGLMFLDNGTIGRSTNFMYYQNDFSNQGNPQQPSHYYNYMRSIWTDGSPLTYGGNGYQTGNPTTFFYTGDAGFCGGPASGWTEAGSGNIPFDRRMLQSFGPFNLAAGEKVEFDYTMLWARGFYNDELGSVCELKRAAAVVDSFWQAQPKACFDIVLSRPEPPISQVDVELYPNPNQGRFLLEFMEAPQLDANLAVYDLAGRKVHAEILPAQQRRYEISTGSLPEGVYLVRVQNEQMALTRKMVVRH